MGKTRDFLDERKGLSKPSSFFWTSGLVIFISLMPLSPMAETSDDLLSPAFHKELSLHPLALSHEAHSIQKNSSVHEALMASKITPQIIHRVVQATRSIFDLRHVQPGTRFVISKEPDGDIHRITFHITPLSRLQINHKYNQWTSEIVDLKTTKKLVSFAGPIDNNLWLSAMEQKVPPNLIADFAAVFAWEVDFSREVRKGDHWKFTVEKLYAQGVNVGWGKIIHAQYQTKSDLHRAYFYHHKPTGTRGYFNEKGESLHKAFLKSPISFGRVTSRFSRRRFHPVLKRFKAHNGVDYGAPQGTPIRSIGEGQIRKIGRYGGSGKMIVIDHMSGYQTKYLHMSRFSSGMKRGKRITQGQVIGYVGATGYATGPHLHFEMSQYGRLVDPLRVNVPSSTPVPKNLMAHFKLHMADMNRAMASFNKPEAQKLRDSKEHARR